MADAVARIAPLDTVLQRLDLPTRASIALDRGDSTRAIDLIHQSGTRYASWSAVAYLRRRAYLAQHNAEMAVAAFQDAPNGPHAFPLVWLGLARALAFEAGVDVTANPIRARAIVGSDALAKARESEVLRAGKALTRISLSSGAPVPNTVC